MIQTIADFLDKLREKERERLPEYDDIQHPGLFGEMYEGLTKALVEKAIFKGMDLRIASGKIRNSKGNLSGQIDCMVVIGDGEPIPHTNHFTYPVDQVVMIVEVKKTLNGAKLNEAMELYRHFWQEVAEVNPPQIGLINDSWRSLFKRKLPKAEEVSKLPFHEQMIYNTILVEAVLPLRVVFGYDGYADEFGLRKGIVGYLQDITSQSLGKQLRFNINSFPNLIVCRSASLIKLDGMPYPGMIDERGFWWWVASRGAQPFRGLLELLWTRLAYRFNLGPEIFGDDLEMESVTPLLAGKAVVVDDRGGWKYENLSISKDKLQNGLDRKAWHPPTLNTAEFVVVNLLCRKGGVDIADKEFLELLAREGETVESLCSSLNQKALTTVVDQKLMLITDECACMFLADGRCVAAENKSGRLSRYAMKVTEEVRRRPTGQSES